MIGFTSTARRGKMSSLLYFSILALFTSVFCYDYRQPYREDRFSTNFNLAQIPANSSAYLLPTYLSPTFYNLTITPFFNNNTFDGKVTITFDVTVATDVIVLSLNNDSIPISSVRASVESSKQAVEISSPYDVNTTYEMVAFRLNETLLVQDAVNITLTYQGILGQDMLGFYLSTYNVTYVNTTQVNHTMAVTQFESTYARRAFPCFDEPSYRAQFSISLRRPVGYTSLSNMPLHSSTLDEKSGLYIDSYETTPLMPTYLVAFAVTDLKKQSDGQPSNNVTVSARATVIQDAAYILSQAQRILDNIGGFLNTTYPLPKMDVVAVPDFDAGAMENWGLTTFREKYVLYDPLRNTMRDKFNALSVVAHEFGHQWFGDLVTPWWWSCTWLNEAFATYFEYTVPDKLEPGWGVGSSMYVMSAVQYALDLDTGSPRPMTSDVWTPQQIEGIFDFVIYEKGGSILRMTENFLTTPVWRAGLFKYLTANGYRTGSPNELFSALQDAADAVGISNVNETLLGWTTQPGYPLVSVTTHTSSQGSVTYNITQSPYALDGYTLDLSSISWNIPLTYTTQSQQIFDASKAPSQWIYSNSSSGLLHVNDSGWIVVNVEEIGYYRVNYDQSNWNKLKAQLDTDASVISSINRAQIIDDAFHLARTGHLAYSTVFGLTHYLPSETTLTAWQAFFYNLKYLLNQFYNTPTGEGLQQYAQNVIAGPFQDIVSDLEKSTNLTFMRSYVITLAGQFSCDVGLPDCLQLANDMFEQWRNNISNPMRPEVTQTVMCAGLRQDTSVQAFLDVMDYYYASDNAAEKLSVLNALGCLSNSVAITTYLDIVTDVNQNYIRLQDRWIAFRALASQQSGISTVLQYIVNNFPKVSNALGSRFSSVMSTLGRSIIQPAHIAQVKQILNNTSVDQKLKDMLSSSVMPAVSKRLAWTSSTPAAQLQAWVTDYMGGDASAATASTILVTAALAILLFKL